MVVMIDYLLFLGTDYFRSSEAALYKIEEQFYDGNDGFGFRNERLRWGRFLARIPPLVKISACGNSDGL